MDQRPFFSLSFQNSYKVLIQCPPHDVFLLVPRRPSPPAQNPGGANTLIIRVSPPPSCSFWWSFLESPWKLSTSASGTGSLKCSASSFLDSKTRTIRFLFLFLGAHLQKGEKKKKGEFGFREKKTVVSKTNETGIPSCCESFCECEQGFLVPPQSWRTVSGTTRVVAPELVFSDTDVVVAAMQETMLPRLFSDSTQRLVPHPLGRQCGENRDCSFTGWVLLPTHPPQIPPQPLVYLFCTTENLQNRYAAIPHKHLS